MPESLASRKRKDIITDGEWKVIIQFEHHGEPIGEPISLRYSDTYLAGVPSNVGYLIAGAMNERANQIKGGLRKKRTR